VCFEPLRRGSDLAARCGALALSRRACDELIAAGADAVKVGIGPGSICTTRVVAGVGVPQVTAIADCYATAGPRGIPIIADGGVRYSGDMAKAIAIGAQSVMLGGLLAGVDKSPGEVMLYQGERFKDYRGMGSMGAMQGSGGSERYSQANAVSTGGKLVPEGIEGRVPYKGPTAELAYQLVGGLRAGMGYCGCQTIPELQERAKVQVLWVDEAGFLIKSNGTLRARNPCGQELAS